MLATNDESYLKSCRYSTEHPYCPIFLLGNIVQWAGSDFQEMALEVGVSLGPMWLPSRLYWEPLAGVCLLPSFCVCQLVPALKSLFSTAVCYSHLN